MAQELLSTEHLMMITTGFVVGTLARLMTLREDYRQYPSYPNGYIIHVVTGAVAAAIGAVAIPSLLTKNFVGVSFLALAIQQFRDVRKMEKSSLHDLEQTEFTARGTAYIDGIAKTFEARNYLSLICAFLTVLTMTLIPGNRPLLDIACGAAVGTLAAWLLWNYTKGRTLGEIADIRLAQISFDADMLCVDDIIVKNVGLPDAQARYLEEGMAVMITPRDADAQIALANYGQRQAIIHEAARTLGLKRYICMRRDFDNGRICFAMIPIHRDARTLLKLVAEVPLLESTKKSARMRDPELVADRKGE
ncbi:YIEGIA domain-containing protein [Tumebacillus lipolyticus]|uniref:YIEGIA domain-containing protein n=1 Tax=Tumebacillus lipolyticus TaxID=1280370 RepID=A0ABW4ZSW4_9BACL